ncbi:uncharacterized protein EV154DRAFT_488455 [Mucor mucedo]|uniref:uncharacterized protein n=1 Tax=Mucor mucedo TaxID=29922 RepID=UPI00221F1CA4|nr:uncharacterized protein EV154DRAFT_488455 [Mucor mucedo]KAI7866931.1 hypothetical protein EV154DRAFT_488455 [Mucor mucedo]
MFFLKNYNYVFYPSSALAESSWRPLGLFPKRKLFSVSSCSSEEEKNTKRRRIGFCRVSFPRPSWVVRRGRWRAARRPIWGGLCRPSPRVLFLPACPAPVRIVSSPSWQLSACPRRSRQLAEKRRWPSVLFCRSEEEHIKKKRRI